MTSNNHQDLIISGLGITTPIGQGAKDVTDAMLSGQHNFSMMTREGRQYTDKKGQTKSFIGAQIDQLSVPDGIGAGLLRTASFSAKVALATIHEAWHDANLDKLDGDRVGLIVGGSNFQQRDLALTHQKYAGREAFMRPTYAMGFMDSDICALSSEIFGIKGFAHTLGAASASGQVAIIQGIQSVISGQVDACVVVGALMDLSYWECQGFVSAGAMGSVKFADQPHLACRPFDKNRDGFIFGENCGAVVIEKTSSASRRQAKPYAKVMGWGLSLDANRNPNPSSDGQINVIEKALALGQIEPAQIDYINAHGTGSPLGDETELSTIRKMGLDGAWINTSKSVVGHGLTSAGTVECILTLLQMQAEKLHPCLNLDEPICDVCKFVRPGAIEHTIEYALNLSYGFGGVNSALCLARA